MLKLNLLKRRLHQLDAQVHLIEIISLYHCNPFTFSVLYV